MHHIDCSSDEGFVPEGQLCPTDSAVTGGPAECSGTVYTLHIAWPDLDRHEQRGRPEGHLCLAHAVPTIVFIAEEQGWSSIEAARYIHLS